MPVRHTAYLLLGSNMGDRPYYLRMAEKMISRRMDIIRSSPVYETSPWGKLAQGDYLNCVLETRTSMGPFQLLRFLSGIEDQFGRTGKGQMMPRRLDIDILFYGDAVITSKKLSVPHPRMGLRRFVLQPLYDIAPDLIHPQTGLNVREMLAVCEDKGEVRKFDAT